MNWHVVTIGSNWVASRLVRAVAKSYARTGAPQRPRSDLPRVQAETAAQRQGCTLRKPFMGRSSLKGCTAKWLSAILLIVVGQSLAHAEWGFVDSVDDFTDEQIRFAHYSDDDHRIQLSRHDDNSVWMYITRKKFGSFEPNTPVEYRVDQGMLSGESMVEFSMMVERIGNAPTYIWGPGTVAFLVWHGDPEAARPDPCGFIGELLSGSVLRVRYHISSLDRDSFSADLADADEAIVNGLSVDACADQE